VGETDPGHRGIDHNVVSREVELPAGGQPRLGEIADHALLAVDGDRPASTELGQRDPVRHSVEEQFDAVVRQAVAVEPRADAGLAQQVDGALLEHTRADPLLDVLPAASLDHDGLDAAQVQQV